MKKVLRETFDPGITRHFAIAKRAYDCGIIFGLGLTSVITEELQDYGIKIEERACLNIIEELFNKGKR